MMEIVSEVDMRVLITIFCFLLLWSKSASTQTNTPKRDSNESSWKLDDATVELTTLEMQKDHKVVVAGRIFNGRDDDFAIARFTEEGTPDLAFGAEGLVVTDIDSSNDKPSSITLTQDEKILVTGESCWKNKKCSIVVTRYTVNGQLDRSFGRSGRVVGKPNEGVLKKPASLSFQTDGQIVVEASLCKGEYLTNCTQHSTLFTKNGQFIEERPVDITDQTNNEGDDYGY